MARPKAVQPAPEPTREPDASFDIPPGLLECNLGVEANRTCNPWAMDRLLAYLGAHSVDIIDSVAVSNDGKYARMVRAGDKLLIFDRL
jgi:hypothetical protein